MSAARDSAAGAPPEVSAAGAPPEVSAVIPTIGRSPWLGACLAALRCQTGVRSLEILVVDQSPRPLALSRGLADRVLRPDHNLGFAGGTNLGLAAARGELLAMVNDDAVVGPGWLAALTAALRGDPGAAAAQGVNLLAGPGDMEAAAATAASPPKEPKEPKEPREAAPPDARQPPRIDGCGLGWNRWWQAIQLGHGMPAPVAAAAIEIFGVSATAALFRRSALERVAPDGRFFDPRLISYYEDAELAGRLRAAGYRALLAPAARALHAGSASGRTAAASRERWRLIYGNRYLAAARLLGRGLWPRLPWMLLRDLLDLAAASVRDDRPGGTPGGDHGARGPLLAGVLAGWARAMHELPAFARRGAPAAPLAEVVRLSRWPPQAG